MTLFEAEQAAEVVRAAANTDINTIFGSVINENLSDEVIVTVIATGFDRKGKTESKPVYSNNAPNRRSREEVTYKDVLNNVNKDEEIGNQDLGLFIRSIVGLDRAVAKQAFSKFLNGDVLNSVQMEFLDLIIDYIVKNGYVESFNILQEAPFDQVGKVSEIYENNLDKFKEIRNVIVEFKNNANTESLLNQNGIF